MAAHFFLIVKIALATSDKYPHLTDDDRLLLRPLAALGLEAEPAVWDNSCTDWLHFAAVVIRSCWDYHLKPKAFLEWIAKLDSARIPVFNSPALLRWNTDKSYLRDLDAKGIDIVPTFWADDHGFGSSIGHRMSLQGKLHQLGWHKAVVKPRISATAYRTRLVTQDTADSAQALFDELQRGPGVMVQTFMESISSEGEWSLIFFDGKFSHAILKKPRPGDFRVQNDFGGTSRLTEPPSHVLASATRAVQAVEATAYARVDGVVDDNRFRLMELELIEPMLFLADCADASTRFANTIAQALARNT